MQQKELARKSLDRRLNKLREMKLTRPNRGWIRAIRESLGMTTKQLAARARVSQPRIVALEKAEAQGKVTLATLEQIAAALDCDFVYALVPREPLEKRMQRRAERLAHERLKAVSHSMLLEKQQVASSKAETKRLIESILRGDPKKLWDHPA